MTNQDKEALWTGFLQEWPLEQLATMPLERYTNGDRNSFIYWLEKKTEDLGSIWGGTALKFGVYARKDQSEQKDEKGRMFSAKYGWMSKYGKTAQEAYLTVRAHVAAIAKAARAGHLEEIDAIDLGPAIKWKIAFLYQNCAAPCIVPIFKHKYLEWALGKEDKSFSTLQHLALSHAPEGISVLELGEDLLQRIKPHLQTELSPEEAKSYLDALENCQPLTTPTQKMAGYGLDSGKQIALALDNKKTSIFLSPGAWLDSVRSDLHSVTPYPSERRRSSNLQANAPLLAEGHEAVLVVVPTMSALIKLCDAYCADDEDPSAATMQKGEKTMPPLNQILFGPPGTGKTYETVRAALSILDPQAVEAYDSKLTGDDSSEAKQVARKVLKERFDELASQERIRFVTFHQSFSYEDFIEGLRATTNEDNQLTYQVEAGIFKRLCDQARASASPVDNSIRTNPRIWKVSVNGTGASPTKSYCLDHGEIRIGSGDTGDLREGKNSYFETLGPGDKGTLRYFAEEMMVGDIVLCIHSAAEIEAIGVVRGDYRYDAEPPSGIIDNYQHVRTVQWLYRDLQLPILPLNDNKSFTLKTVYPIDRFSWGDLLSYLQKNDAKPVFKQTQNTERPPYVLVIDEINRGNISRIFGELITLIEPSKREGASEALSTELPYSKMPFSVPDNVYLIGTMNTADRSLSGLDLALRRRFTFTEMPPRPKLLDDVIIENGDEELCIGEMLQAINQRITILIDRDHMLGHAYFMPLQSEPSLQKLEQIFRNSVLPLLQEYFFEDWQRIHWVLNDHNKPNQQHRFICKDDALNLSSLFGNVPDLQHPQACWKLNDMAFSCWDSYAGIAAGAGATSNSGAKVKREVSFKEITIKQLASGTIEVWKTGELQKPTKPHLRDICQQLGIDTQVKYTTRSMGNAIIRALDAQAGQST